MNDANYPKGAQDLAESLVVPDNSKPGVQLTHEQYVTVCAALRGAKTDDAADASDEMLQAAEQTMKTIRETGQQRPIPPYVQFVAELLSHTLRIIITKNNDYAGVETGHGPMWNFENAARMTNTNVRTVLISRMTDKLSRLANAATGQSMQVDESVLDTCIDMIGYACLQAWAIKTGSLPLVPNSSVATKELATVRRERSTAFTPSLSSARAEAAPYVCEMCAGTGYANDSGSISWADEHNDEWPTPTTVREEALSGPNLTLVQCCECDGTGLNTAVREQPCSGTTIPKGSTEPPRA